MTTNKKLLIKIVVVFAILIGFEWVAEPDHSVDVLLCLFLSVLLVLGGAIFHGARKSSR
jgi:hypothetical protein